jgi:CheY-like chemotaxis protein
MRSQPCDCVVLDLRLPDMSGFEVLDRLRNDETLSNVPVVVFTGRELSAEEDAELHTMARSIVVKGVESPERLLDETSLFLHRVITELPVEKQRIAPMRIWLARPRFWLMMTPATFSRCRVCSNGAA